MSYKIKRLYDGKKQRPVKASDIDKDRFKSREDFKVDGEKYTFWIYDPSDGDLIQSNYVHDKVLWSGRLEEAPVEIYSNIGGRLRVNKKTLAKNLCDLYGEGRIVVKEFGGYQGMNWLLKNRFIEKRNGSDF